MSRYFPVHAHSQFSGMDGMNTVGQIAHKVAALDQEAWALTDHGGMPGTVQGYKESRKRDLRFFPGEEFYLVRDVTDPDTKATRYHVGLLALDFKGYEALTRLSSLSWQEDRFYYKPLIDLSDLAFLAEEGHSQHLALTTGCYSGLATQTLLKDGPEAIDAILRMFAGWFPHTYVELQDHGITWADHNGITDNQIAETMWAAAHRLGLPVLFGQDSHYIEPEQQPVHDLMKDICYFGAGEDSHFSGGPYHLATADEIKPKMRHMMDDVEAGHADLLAKHAVTMPPLDNYKFQVPRMFKNADAVLREKAEVGLFEMFEMDEPPRVYWERLDHELDVIEKMGMANYHLLVKEHVIQWPKDHGIIVNVRGSANGSLVCRAIGITTVDPIKWGTSFERYLSLNRMKPPDIDVDVDFRGRSMVVEHLKQVWPTMVQVGTYAQIGFSRTKGGSVEDDRKGSIMVQYMAAFRKKDPEHFDGKVKDEHWDALEALALTPVYKSMGTNPSGFILPGDDYPIGQYLPLARIISSNTTLTQYNKDDVEAMGFLKIDLLGLKALQTLNGTLTRIGREPNEWGWIPIDDKVACKLLRDGKTAGVFQYEGFTQRKGGMEMKIRSTLDAIFGLALYRPALINGGQKDQYLANRFATRQDQARLHPIFDPVLDVTAGVPLYQEQVMGMLQAIQMEYQDYNDLMTAIKASNGFIAGAAETFRRLQPVFCDLCEDAGLDYDDIDHAWNAVVGFTEYGFNRAHSTSYGLMAYWAAYLKAHYPKEFLVSLLSVWADDQDRTREYAAEAHRMGYSIVRPDVNASGIYWEVEQGRPQALRKGLLTVPGVGYPIASAIVAERDAHGPYTSIQDFIDRLPARPVSGGKDWKAKGELKGVCKALYQANAFRSVGSQ